MQDACTLVTCNRGGLHGGGGGGEAGQRRWRERRSVMTVMRWNEEVDGRETLQVCSSTFGVRCDESDFSAVCVFCCFVVCV